MRVLILNQFFWPDAAATSQLATDLARALAAHGCQVTAIRARTAYAPADAGEPPPVRILSVPALPFHRGPLARPLCYISFFLCSTLRALREPRPDLVITLTTPPLLCLVGTLIKKLRGCVHYIWEMDLYPEVAVDLGVLREGSLATRALRALANWSRRRSDGILALGECMRERLIAAGAPPGKIHIAGNWADGGEIRPLPAPEGPFTVLYSGNFGLAHDVDTIRSAVARLADDQGIRFVFAGGGPRRAGLEEFCRREQISNVVFRPYAARRELARHLAEGHVGLATQMERCLGSVVASKVYGILAAGRPVLFIGPRSVTPARILERFRCGWQIDCGDVDGLVLLLKHLAAHPELAREAGERARQAFLAHYDRPMAVARFCAILGLSVNDSQSVAPCILTPDS